MLPTDRADDFHIIIYHFLMPPWYPRAYRNHHARFGGAWMMHIVILPMLLRWTQAERLNNPGTSDIPLHSSRFFTTTWFNVEKPWAEVITVEMSVGKNLPSNLNINLCDVQSKFENTATRADVPVITPPQAFGTFVLDESVLEGTAGQ